ncbi:MAG: Hsp20/alpha crystallin family protein [Planctomycetaceae bacterium]
MDEQTRGDGPLSASVQRLRQEFDRWLEAAMSQGGKALDALGLRGSRPWYPAIDVIETPDTVCVAINLPGVDADSVDVSIAGNMLTVKGEAPEIAIGDHDTAHMRQRNAGPFERSIPMPVAVDSERVSAEAKLGVLTIRLAKSERTQTRQIPIRTGEGD